MRITRYILTWLLASACALAASNGNLAGIVTDSATATPLAGIRVVVQGTNTMAYTDSKGEFTMKGLPYGNLIVRFSGPGWLTEQRTVIVADDVFGSVSVALRSTSKNTGDVVVYGAARRKQKLTDAPAAVSVVTPLDIERGNAHGSIGKTMEHLPGVDVVQSGANDFNINTRGFNNSITRRTLVLIDGRDPSTPLINLNEWNSISSVLGDIAGIEVVRGPGSALYGQNAYNGVINMRTYAPREVLGTRVSITGGEWETYRASIRHAGAYDKLAYKINIGASTQYNYGLVPRTTTAEYPSLDTALRRAGALDKKALSDAAKHPFEYVGTARLDYDITDDERMTVEGGMSISGNEMYVNQTGRLLVQRVEKPFVRAAYNSSNINVQALWQRRNTPEAMQQLVYNANARSLELSDVLGVDAQYNNTLMDGALRYIVGAQYEYHDVSSPTDSAGKFLADMTLISPTRVTAIFGGAYGQLEWKAADKLTLVGAARVDQSRLFPLQFSPKLALVFEPAAGQSLRLTLNRSFLRPSYTELFRRSPAGAPRDLTAVGLAVDSVLKARFGDQAASNLNLGQTSRWNVGNPELEPEKALSIELGYRGSVTKNLFVSADLYYNRRSDLISAPLGGITPEVYTPWRTNSGNSEWNAVGDSVLLAQIGKADFDRLVAYEGKAALAISPANVAAVDEYGAELALTYALTNDLTLNANYAYLDYKVASNDVPAQKIVANTSRHRANIGLDYVLPNALDVSVNARWVDAFTWLAGAFEGSVPTYWVVNMSVGYYVMPSLRVSANVFNALDNAHYEIFGGTILRRQATMTATYTF
ncbi:MAG: TonB-dependent receptor [Candidatus Kapabacteria bacterium]|nr:TonB-dependent receptor [Candidatus Kapabacteria bacterium]